MNRAASSLLLLAPAKINLTLRILAERADGYHEIDSVMQKLDLADTLRMNRLDTPGIVLKCPNSTLSEDASNLVYQAAYLLLQETNLLNTYGVSIVLEKRIPVAAGLGGGSSDAGTVLSGLNDLLGTNVSLSALLRMGKTLGADVPFFVLSAPAVRAQGIGERMSLVSPLADCSVLLVNPGFSVSTAWVYKNFTLTIADKVSILSDSRDSDAGEEDTLLLSNDLESLTIAHYPEIAGIKDVMLTYGATGALMSGSGPTVFGVFHDNVGSDVRGCAEMLRDKYGAGVFVTKPLQ